MEHLPTVQHKVNLKSLLLKSKEQQPIQQLLLQRVVLPALQWIQVLQRSVFGTVEDGLKFKRDKLWQL